MPRGAQVEIFHTGGLAKSGKLEAGRQSLGVPLSGLAVDQKAQALFEAKAVERGRRLALLVQCLDHAGEAEGDEPLGSRMDQQGKFSFQW